MRHKTGYGIAQVMPNKTALFFQALAERCRRIDPAALIALYAILGSSAQYGINPQRKHPRCVASILD